MKEKDKAEEKFFLILFVIFILIIVILFLFEKPRKLFLEVLFSWKKKKVYKSEEITRQVFEDLFSESFPKCKPKWLINPKTKAKLELDGYCPSIQTPLGMGLAFEYDGSQHREFNPRFHKTMEDFRQQQFRDQIKDFLCKQRKIMLIRVPDSLTTKPKIEAFVRSKVTWT